MYSQKLFTLSDGALYGGCGDYSEVLNVLAWLQGEADKPADLQDCAAIVVRPGGAYRLEERLVLLPIQAPHACGSGRDFAIAAMALGQTAQQAVALAMQFDPWTGGEIMTLTL